MTEIGAGVGMFTVVVLFLVGLILVARSRLVPSGDVNVLINNDPDRSISVPTGGKLLNALADCQIFVSSACGGGGTCAQCKVHVHEGGGDILATELEHITKGEARDGMRLSCQVSVKQDMKIDVPAEVFSVRKWECEVVSNNNVATFIKELVLKLPEGEILDFESGGFIQIEVPPFECSFRDFDIEEEFHDDWNRFSVWDLRTVNTDTVVRAFSMANHPAEGNIVMLNIRVATPPPDREKGGWMNVNPGIVSSYVFNLKPGDNATISGPFGEFFIQETQREMMYVGGGAGMAPLRSSFTPNIPTARFPTGTVLVPAKSSSTRIISARSRRSIRTSSSTWLCPSRCQRTTGPATSDSFTRWFSTTTCRNIRRRRISNSIFAVRR